MIKTTQTVENYELKICSIIKSIQEVERLVQNRKGIKQFSKENPDKIIEVMVNFRDAKMKLQAAIECLLAAGN